MSQEKLNEIQKRIKQIESIYRGTPQSKPQQQGNKKKEYGSYQHFQSECMKKTDEANPNSPSRIEVITGNYGAHSTERMAQCSRLWNNYRSLDHPVDGLMKELDVAEKVERGEYPEE